MTQMRRRVLICVLICILICALICVLQALLWESNDDSNEATRLVQKELDMYGGAGALLLIKADKRLQNLVLREALCHEPG